MNPKGISNRFVRQLTWSDIDPDDVRQIIRIARAEDIAGFGLKVKPDRSVDVTSELISPDESCARPRLIARHEMVVCGLPLIPLILETYGSDATFTAEVKDGTTVQPKDSLGYFEGNPVTILQAERIILNFLQKLSGTASLTNKYVQALGETKTRLLDTRKTTPGYRVLEKYAVACGGGFNHRIGLFDRIMLKDNHLEAAAALDGSRLGDLVKRAKASQPNIAVEVEVDRIEQIMPVIEAGADIVLLDNFSHDELKSAVSICHDKIVTEASGGILLKNLKAIAEIGLDFISTGATVHQSQWVDIGLDWSTE